MERILDLLKKYKYLILSVVIILIIAVGGVIFYFFKDKKIEDIGDENVVSVIEQEKNEEKNEETKEENITVDVKGEVNKPGVYKLPVGSRVIDAIKISGGTTKKADTSLLNLSKILTDENVIIVYNKYSQQTVKYVEKECNCSNNDGCINNNNVVGNDSESSTNEKISINKATKEELMKLSGIGESKALDIINYRNENGLFKSIEDLKQISGIGEKLFEKIKDQITI